MKKAISLLLSFMLLLTGCNNISSKVKTSQTEATDMLVNSEGVILRDPIEPVEPTYTDLSSPELLGSIEDTIYAETIAALDGKQYVVESVTAIFISQDYIDEITFNSQANIFFGYTLEEINDYFQGIRYVFTLGEDGTTVCQQMLIQQDNSFETIIKDVAIGTGVILICITVSCLTAGTAPAVSVIFAASAKSASIMAVSGGAFGAASAGIVRGIETGDMGEAVKAAAMGGSKGFKWGAISGAIIGGGKEAFFLHRGTANGLTMNDVALIQKDSKLPMDIISQFNSKEEYAIYKEAGLRTSMIDGRTALIQNVDLDYVSELPDGTRITNMARMQRGLAPIDAVSGKAFELHHVGQKNNGILAMLTQEQHRSKAVDKILHIIKTDSPVDHTAEWQKVVRSFWKYYGNMAAQGGII